MKNTKKKISPITITILSLAVIGVVFASFLIAHLTKTDNPDVETSLPVGDLQDYEFPDFEPIWGQVAFPGEYNKEKDVLVDYAYSDKYFEIDSTIYNPSLSTMSLCLELSAWASYETDVWAEKTRNARKLLDEIGFEDFAQNDFWSDSPSTESIGVVAAHKELADSTLIALPVRGGKYYNEWGSNVNVGSTGEHTGFAEGRDNVIKFLEDYIVAHDITGRVKIWVVGYSRGGAVANLVAGYLNENELPNGATLAFEDLYCYAFEPPQGSIVELAGSNADHANIHNIVNPNDLVTMVAPVDWEFTRYNSTSRLLPTITTAEFESALAVMLEEYEEILSGVEIPDPAAAIYNVSEYAKRIDVNVNPLNFLPGGDPMVDIQIVDDTSQTMNEVLTRFITAFAGSLDGRAEYNSALEADLIYLLDQLMGYETGFEMDAILASVTEVMTADGGENLKYVLAPVFSLNNNSAEERTEQVVARLHEVLPQPEGFTDLYGTAATLIKAAGNLLVNHPDELLDIALAFTNSKVMQSHYEEITLAWVRAGDPHYTDTPYTMAVPETLRTVRVNCPVNVEIYDSEGNLVASMIDGVATTKNAVVGCALNEDGEIIVHLPADAEYEIVTTATGDGEVNVTLSEYNVVHSKITRVQNYADIPVAVGDVLTLTAPDLIEEEYTDEEHQGSTAEYQLSDNSGETIPYQSESRGSDIEYFDVSVHTNNTFGAVNGGGQYLDGTFAMVEAQPVAGGEFIGWYAHGELVSTDSAYRFAVDENTSLTAHFSEVSLYKLTFGTSDGGTVANTDHAYTVGSRVQLSAEANEGYEFDHWETSAGTVENASDAQTVFIVSDGDAAITAVFKIKICPVCHEEFANGETHTANCGSEDHYSCDGGNHQLSACGHFACADGEHQSLACGHFNCDNGNHGTLDCGHYACGGGDHKSLNCGHYSCSSGKHGELSCGHYACSGGSHDALNCGHYSCDNGNHGTLPCGHYACESRDHGKLGCGHYSCDDGEHEEIPCGHYACESGNHGTLSCGHYACESGNHRELSCGHYACDGGSHRELSCGHYACGSGDHGSLSCGHYACESGDHGELPCGHYACGSGDHGKLSCGHYACDSGNHGSLSCGHYACDGGDHGSLSCGHYSCDSGNHGTLPCEHYACDSGDHRNLTCGHYACDNGDHGSLSCGHYACDSGDHESLSCGHYACDSGNHGSLSCGHYACESGDHGKLSCGHYACDSGNHGSLSCGHYACESGEHEELSCGHYACESGDHGKLSCGHYACDSGEHGSLSCGHYSCDSGNHGTLPCEHYACDSGDHRNLTCGHYACDNGDHGSLSCGHYACESGNHRSLPCGHYACDGGEHETLSCGHYACDSGNHGSLSCGHYACDSGEHGELSCGHYACDSGDHESLSCGHYACDSGDHESLSCGHYACESGEHGELSCGHYACESGDHTTICDVTGCGQYLCDGHTHDDLCGKCQQPGAHQLDCGHYSCDETVSGMNHDKQSCGHYGCEAGDHTAGACGTDGHYSCSGSHTSASCGTSGHYVCDNKDHTAASCGTSNHYSCDGNLHTMEHACGRGHYTCDGTAGTAHRSLECGHYACDSGEHGELTCGHFACEEGDHTTKQACGHLSCADGDHSVASCKSDGHYACDNLNHSTAECGEHFICDEADHSAASCGNGGHFVCDDADHTTICTVVGCGKALCDGHTHASVCEKCQTENVAHELVCGHFSCEVDASEHGAADCGTSGHYKCNAADHSKAVCSTHYVCAGGEHDVASCGADEHYVCDGISHGTASCGTTGHYTCDGADHGTASCNASGHYVCDDDEHGKAECGTHNVCEGGDHGTASCNISGHYVCDGADHAALCSIAGCGKPLCDGHTHTDVCEKCQTENATHELVCGHYSCEVDAASHGAADCGTDGHYKCDGGDHSLYGEYDWNSCGHYKCDDSVSGLNHDRLPQGCEHFSCDSSAESMDHTYCDYCGYCVCSSALPDGITHGDGSGSCYEWAYSVCKNCGVNTGDAAAHYADCYGLTGHYTCDSDGLDHSAYECGSHFKCSNSDTETEHSQCAGCNYPLCYDGYDHTTCTYCGKRKCEDESEHGEGVCDSEA